MNKKHKKTGLGGAPLKLKAKSAGLNKLFGSHKKYLKLSYAPLYAINTIKTRLMEEFKMKKSILESLRSKDETNKTEFERTEDHILASIDERIFQMESYIDLYRRCEEKKRKQTILVFLIHMGMRLDEIEELNNLLNQLNSGKSAESISGWVTQLDYTNLWDSDHADEEIRMQMWV